MEGLPKKPLQENIEKKKDFKHIEALLDKYPYAYTVEEILDEEFGQVYSPEKEELSHEFYEYIRSVEEKKEIERVKSWEENIKELKKSEKQDKIDLLENFKKLLTPEFIENEKMFLVDKYPLKKEVEAYWIDISAKKLAREYLIKIKKDTTEKAIKNIADEIKTHYRKSKDNNFREIKNYYEIENEEDDRVIFDKFLNKENDDNRLDHSL